MPERDPANPATLGQRQADGLLALASATVAADADPDRATVVAIVELAAICDDDPAATAELETGEPLATETARRLVCDSRLSVLVQDRDGSGRRHRHHRPHRHARAAPSAHGPRRALPLRGLHLTPVPPRPPHHPLAGADGDGQPRAGLLLPPPRTPRRRLEPHRRSHRRRSPPCTPTADAAHPTSRRRSRTRLADRAAGRTTTGTCPGETGCAGSGGWVESRVSGRSRGPSRPACRWGRRPGSRSAGSCGPAAPRSAGSSPPRVTSPGTACRRRRRRPAGTAAWPRRSARARRACRAGRRATTAMTSYWCGRLQSRRRMSSFDPCGVALASGSARVVVAPWSPVARRSMQSPSSGA